MQSGFAVLSYTNTGTTTASGPAVKTTPTAKKPVSTPPFSCYNKTNGSIASTSTTWAICMSFFANTIQVTDLIFG